MKKAVLGISCLFFLLINSCTVAAPVSYEDFTPHYFSDEQEFHAQVLRSVVNLGGGTAFCFKSSDQGSLLLTAAHVVVDWETGIPAKIFNKQGDDFQLTTARVVYIGSYLDLAIVFIPEQLEPLPLMSERDYYGLKPGEEIWSTGFPAFEIQPCLITTGYINETVYYHNSFLTYYLYHTATGWHGFSGGPTVHPASGEVVGVEVLFAKFHRTDECLAVPVPEIHKFIKEAEIALFPQGDK